MEFRIIGENESGGIIRHEVESSNIKSSTHDENRNIMTVTFLNGSIYEYRGLTREVYELYKTGESQGKAFWRYIRNIYPYTKIG